LNCEILTGNKFLNPWKTNTKLRKKQFFWNKFIFKSFFPDSCWDVGHFNKFCNLKIKTKKYGDKVGSYRMTHTQETYLLNQTPRQWYFRFTGLNVLKKNDSDYEKKILETPSGHNLSIKNRLFCICKSF
jgi:hypothetical protein